MSATFTCPVCGWDALIDPPRMPGGGGSYEICPSCGFEFGVTDDDLGETYESWRRRWIDAGKPWYEEQWNPRPEGWDADRQLKDLLDERTPSPLDERADDRWKG